MQNALKTSPVTKPEQSSRSSSSAMLRPETDSVEFHALEGGTVPAYEGRLELTWTNKHLRLLAHDDGSYEWVPPSDYRVAEVRLLHNRGEVGQVGSKKSRAKDNLLIY